MLKRNIIILSAVALATALFADFAAAQDKDLELKGRGFFQIQYAENILSSPDSETQYSDIILKPGAGVYFQLPLSEGNLIIDYLLTYHYYTSESDKVEKFAEELGKVKEDFIRHEGFIYIDFMVVEDVTVSLTGALVIFPINLGARNDLAANQTPVGSINPGIGWAHFWTEMFRTNLRYDFVFLKALDPAFKTLSNMKHSPRFDVGAKFMPELFAYAGFKYTAQDYIEDTQGDLTISEPLAGVKLGFANGIVGSIEAGVQIINREDPEEEPLQQTAAVAGTQPATEEKKDNSFVGERINLGLDIFYYERNTINLRLQASVMPDAYGELNRSMEGGATIKYEVWPEITFDLAGNFKRFGIIDSDNQNTAYFGGPKLSWEFYENSFASLGYSYYQLLDNDSTEDIDEGFTSNLTSLTVDARF